MRLWPQRKREVERSGNPLSFQDYLNYFTFNNNLYGPLGVNQTYSGNKEEAPTDYSSLVTYAYKSNPIVFAVENVRLSVFSEARFQFRQMRDGRPGDLFGTQDLDVLETPWPGGTTGDLLARAIQDADFAGNFFAYRDGNQIYRMRPDWVDIILGSEKDGFEAGDLEARVVGYLFHPGGKNSGRDPVALLREEVAHFAPIPDPLATFRGMSWLTPVIREVMADMTQTSHRSKVFENAATPNMIVKMDPSIVKDQFDSFVEKFRSQHEGAANAYKTLFLGGGADATVVGRDFQQMEFKATQGAGETRIAAAGNVPPIIAGLSEGLQYATYSNYAQAKRRLADGTMRPLWRGICGALGVIVLAPPGSELWYDGRDVFFLQEDQKDAADIQQVEAATIRTLIEAGFEPDSVVDAVTAEDFERLTHTGLTSVQLTEPGAENGKPNGKIELPAGTE